MTMGPGLDGNTNTVSPTFLQKADRRSLQRDQHYSGLRRKRIPKANS